MYASIDLYFFTFIYNYTKRHGIWQLPIFTKLKHHFRACVHLHVYITEALLTDIVV